MNAAQYGGATTSRRDGRQQLDGRRGFSLLVAKEFWRDGPESRAFKVSRRAVS
jgi:hypothetical protein